MSAGMRRLSGAEKEKRLRINYKAEFKKTV
jgi:hypothetical protein